MKFDIKNKTAIITGAGSGIGQAAAVRLSSLGANIVLCGRNKQKLLNTQRLCENNGVKTLILSGDLKDIPYVSSVPQKSAEHFGGIDILINNAGVPQSKPFEEVTNEEYDDIFDTNVKAPFILCRESIKHLKKSPCATIINIASVVAHKGYQLQSAYSASKHALLGLSKVIANEYFKDGIRVHVVSPGGVYTDMVAKARPDLSPDGLITADDIADIIEFFVTSKANAVVDEIMVHRIGKEPFA